MEDGMKLGRWVDQRRLAYYKGTLSEERTQRLEELGLVWDPPNEEWTENYGRLVKYKEEYGNLLVPRNFKTEDGMNLGIWLSTQRTAYYKSLVGEECTQRLEELGFLWDPRNVKWNEKCDRLVKYKEEHGNCLVPIKFEMEDGMKLGRWVSTQRTAYHKQGNKGTLSEERTQRLEELGFVWDSQNTEWDENCDRLVEYKEEHGSCMVPQRFKMEDGMKLGAWVNIQRSAYSKGTLSKECKQRLKGLGFVWDSQNAEWDENCGRLVKYKEEHGNCLVPWKFEMKDGMKLGHWVTTQRKTYSKGTLSKKRTRRLEKLGFVWEIRRSGRPTHKGTTINPK